MSDTHVPAALHKYVIETYAAQDERLLARMWPRAKAAGLPPIMITPDQAAFLRWLIQTSKAKRVLDVGTLFGYSAASMASALPASGRVTSLELEPKNAAVARENLREVGLAKRVEVIEGDARTTLPTLKSASFDLALVDADKSGYIDYLDEAHRLLVKGGILCVDNTLAFGNIARAAESNDPNVDAVARFNQALAKDERFRSALLTVGDGLTVATKR